MSYEEPPGPPRRRVPAVARPAWFPAVVLAFVQVVGSGVAGSHQSGRVQLDAPGYALLLAGPVMLLFRRRMPVAVAAGTGAVTLLYVILGYPYGPIFASLVVAFFSAVAAGHRRAVLVVAAACYTGNLLVGLWLYRWLPPAGDHAMPWAGISGSGAWLLAVLAGAELFRLRREQIARDRRERAEAERRRADEERLRIARELHDVLAHSISVINVQAGVALALIDERPEQVRAALTTIKAASKEALGEVRQVLSALRAPGEAPRSPVPGLDRLPELVDQAGSAGLTAQVVVEGARVRLPPGADLAAFRIVQEALTNIVRHSGSRAARVLLGYGTGSLEVRIDDDGPAVAGGESGGGNGLAGMRERVAALGGTVETGPRPDGGFRVQATLPFAVPSRPSRPNRPSGPGSPDSPRRPDGVEPREPPSPTEATELTEPTDPTEPPVRPAPPGLAGPAERTRPRTRTEPPAGNGAADPADPSLTTAEERP